MVCYKASREGQTNSIETQPKSSNPAILSVDDVIMSGLLNVIGLFSRDVIGWKTRVEFVNSHWSVSIRLLFVGLFVGLFTSLMSRL